MFMYDPIGKTLAEVHKDCGSNMRGYSVFILQDENDKTGTHLDTAFSIGMILKKYPQYSEYKVKYENNYFGEIVLRVLK